MYDLAINKRFAHINVGFKNDGTINAFGSSPNIIETLSDEQFGSCCIAYIL
jgi:hypothetical protein